MRRPVRRAVPLGASSLRSWCSSTISTVGKYRAASAANLIASTAPSAKFGTIAAGTPRLVHNSAKGSFVRTRPAGRADHNRDAAFDRRARERDRGGRDGEIDDDVRPRRLVRENCVLEDRDAGEFGRRVAARRSRADDRGDELHVRHRTKMERREAPHPAERARDGDARDRHQSAGTTFSSGAYLRSSIFMPTFGKLTTMPEIPFVSVT